MAGKPKNQIGPLIHEAARREGRAVRRDRSGGRGGARVGGARPRGSRTGQRLLLQADDLHQCEGGVPPGARGDLRSGAERDQGRVVRGGACKVNNEVKYGLSSSIYTQDVNRAFRAIEDLENGITYVNAPTIGAEAHLPFGGVKQTGNGHREGGWEVFEFYSETKVCYVDFSGKLQKAQMDNYE